MAENKKYPLEGVKVVDLSTIVAAPTAAELLCTFGADVIKVESLGGDGQRFLEPHFQAPSRDDCNPLYTVQNANKKHISLNLKTPEGKETMLKLLEDADIFVTNVRHQGLARLGLDYDTLSKKMPRLIYAHFSGYGPLGPNKDDPGYDSTVFWLRGGMSADWSVAGVPYPLNPTYAFGDTVTASSFFSAILLAIIGREKYGEGTKVETSLYSSAIWCNGQGVVMTQFEKKSLNPDPNEIKNPLIGYYLCADERWVNINQVTTYENDLQRIAKVLGIEEEICSDPRFKTSETLLQNYAYRDLRRKMEDAFAKKPSAEWKKLFQAISMPFDVAVPTREVSQDEQAIVNNYVEEITYQDGTKVMMPVPPMFLSNYDKRKLRPTGKMGENTDEILAGLGYSNETIEKMKENNIVK
ncbi:MAG: CoA transferase [Eubacteriales Family XIII. Incertae Sedis bacterium]|nr:MAG: CoA transferase [Clostridiales Family XIII bacterium]